MRKRENPVEYLPIGQQAAWSRKVQAVYGRPTYAEAKAAHLRLRRELRLMNELAMKNLDEEFEETLTLYRLGVFGTRGTSLNTSDGPESLLALVDQRTTNVD